MPFFTDQLHRNLAIAPQPQRIVSLVPSQTELLYHLGLREEVIGITKFCVHPQEWFRTKTRIGGTKTLRVEKIKLLQPDLIVANKEENVQAQVEELAKHFPVWISDINTLEDAYKMMVSLGNIAGKNTEAERLVASIENEFALLQTPAEKVRTAYLIWKEPYMTVGGDTFVHDMLSRAGFDNIFKHQTRYPAVTIEDLQIAGCQLLILSSEPYPFRQKHLAELQRQLPAAKIILADGEPFSWYGSRLLKAPAYFGQLRSQIEAML
jgi:ABC-type Fe3+-hydroxamate transport system substrate-binding protein